MKYRPESADLDPSILVSVDQFIPNIDGSFRTQYPVVASTAANLSAVAKNAFLAEKLDGTVRLIVGSLTKLYELSGTSWTDRSAGGGSYTTSTQGWSFAQLDDTTIAVNKENGIQTSSSGAFAALGAGSPALCCAISNDALALWNIVKGGVDTPNGLSISDIGNISQFTPAADYSNLSYYTEVTDTPGEGTAAIAFGDMIVFFKRRGVYTARFVGAPLIWDVQCIERKIGCFGKDACVVAGDILYFADDHGVWSFDGSSIQSLTDRIPISKTIAQDCLNTGSSDAKTTELHYDDQNRILSIYPGGSAQNKSRFWAINTVTGEPGFATITGPTGDPPYELCSVRAPFSKLVGIAALGLTYSAKENRVVFVNGTGSTVSILQSGHTGYTLNGVHVLGSAYFGDFGQSQLMRRINASIDSATGITVTVTANRGPYNTTQQQSTSTGTLTADLRADVLARGNFFQVTFTLDNTANFTKFKDWAPELIAAGRR